MSKVEATQRETFRNACAQLVCGFPRDFDHYLGIIEAIADKDLSDIHNGGILSLATALPKLQEPGQAIRVLLLIEKAAAAQGTLKGWEPLIAKIDPVAQGYHSGADEAVQEKAATLLASFGEPAQRALEAIRRAKERPKNLTPNLLRIRGVLVQVLRVLQVGRPHNSVPI